MRQIHFKLLLIVGLTLSATSAFAQTAKPDWETLRPEGEEFTVLMPKGSTFETSKEPYHKMELNTRTYLFKTQNGPLYAVMSLSGIKSNPALYTEMQRMNSYVDAFKTFFTPKVRKDAVSKLTLVGEKTLQGNAGREYRLTIAELSGTAQVFATRKRFYSIVFLSPKKDDAIQEEFLSSFMLPEKVEQPKTAAAATPAAEVAPQAEGEQAAKNTESGGGEAASAEAPSGGNAQSAKRGPISGGLLNGKALSLPKPEYPSEVRAAGIEGVVVVQVSVDEQGNVTDARAIQGPAQLQDVSVKAALAAKFPPTLLSGEPVKVTGLIVYNFGRPQS
jgi:TonB family protein